MLPTITLLSPSSPVFKNDAQFILEVLYRLRIFEALSCRIMMLPQRTKYSCEVSFASSQFSVQITNSSYHDILTWVQFKTVFVFYQTGHRKFLAGAKKKLDRP